MRTTVIGLGYVGLVTAAGATMWRHATTGVDVEQERVDLLRSGRVPFHEPGLEEAVRDGLAGGLFSVSTHPAAAVDGAELVFVAVGTHDGGGGWQTRTMTAALEGVVPHLGADASLVIRSTLPPAYLHDLPGIVRDLRTRAGRGPVPVLLNPEFTKEGTALQDFLEPSRVVIGRIDDPDGRGTAALRRFYAEVRSPVLDMEGIDASLAKLGSNLFLATKISFANELAALCDLFGASVDEVVPAMGLDPRIGTRFLRAGVGFGGSCLPHQVTMTIRDARAAGRHMPLLEGVEAVNIRQREQFVHELEAAVGGRLAGARVALLGLTFKPDTDDLRDAPALEIARDLLHRGATVLAHDPMPVARARALHLAPGLVVCDSIEAVLRGADVVGLLTEWPDYVSLDWTAARTLVAGSTVVDGRNALDPEDVARAGFRYRAFGRGREVVPAPVFATVPAPAVPLHALPYRGDREGTHQPVTPRGARRWVAVGDGAGEAPGDGMTPRRPAAASGTPAARGLGLEG